MDRRNVGINLHRRRSSSKRRMRMVSGSSVSTSRMMR